MIPRLSGLFAAAHSPFDASGALACEVVERQAEFHLEQGLAGVFVAGSTGEWPTLTVNERMSLADAWIAAGRGRLRVFVHVGGLGVEDATLLANHAQDLGVDAIAAMCPPGSGARTACDVIDHLEPVALAADATPFFYYDIPSVTGLDVRLDEVLEEGLDRIDTLCGAKYTATDLACVTSALDLAPGRLQVLMGCDEMLLGALATGVEAAIGSTYNYAAPIYRQVMDAFHAHDLDGARQAQSRAVAMVRVLKQAGVLGGGKAIMRWMGVDVGCPREAADIRPAHADALYDAIVGIDPVRTPNRC